MSPLMIYGVLWSRGTNITTLWKGRGDVSNTFKDKISKKCNIFQQAGLLKST
jgi:hypothetical protein